MARDYYEVLGIDRGASADDIRKAHRKLARKLHPDVNKAADAQARFAEIQEAYDILSDEEKRKRYDQFGHAGVSGAAAAGPGTGARGASAGSPFGGAGQWQDVDPETFESIFSNFGDFFSARGGSSDARSGAGRQGARSGSRGGAWPGGGGWSGGAPNQGADVEAETTVAFETAALGGRQSLRLRGVQGRDEEIELKIPAGLSDGTRMRLRGKGHPAPGGGTPGDLVVTVRVTPHPWFRREGLDIILGVPLTIAEASLGTSVTVPLLQGSVTLKVPPGARSGRRLRVKGKGITDAKGVCGDFYAELQIVAPETLTAEDRDALEAMSARLPDPRRNLWT
ncbi:MAG: DnaJ domain-containing protein [Phycisphaeraceae bacterium]|nr:DnaJ domain-containing protein [Phycisphaeraceae bacterium]